MNTFCGCDTESLDALAERLLAGAERIGGAIERIRATSAAVAWFGPDAMVHQQATGAVAGEAADLCIELRGRAKQLQEESAQQTVASQSEGGAGEDPVAAAQATWLALLTGPLRPTGPQDGPEIGFRAPFDVEDMPTVTWPEGLGAPGPWMGGPFSRQEPIDPSRSLPEGEEFGFTEEALAHGHDWRRTFYNTNRYTAAAQTLMDGHDLIGEGLDRAESALVDDGHEEFVPLVDLARVPHDVSSLVAGENSLVGDVTEGIEHVLANGHQTSTEVADALGHGDVLGAVRAGERGIYRHRGAVTEIALAGQGPHIPAVLADTTGHTADAIAPISPETAEGLRTVQERSEAVSTRLEGRLEAATDTEQWYDARRRYMPMPWDPQG
ncbi:hypothetical protein [Brachybacterium sacelli]|uniref:WXG100 family type VII secretion target n=1 Tax=Brachybacterium sacelli TaxID=173364 RepID=A0ABS4X200_9MICO|nr:hypothetical protein [Brachybacterium sacelli]MBP2382376.1 hypothetical protein [Brachybacterium sacelli]